MKYKLRPSVAVVEIENGIEFFLTNIRKSLFLYGLQEIKEFLFKFDGKKNFETIFKEENLNSDEKKDALKLIRFLNKNKIMLEMDEKYHEDYSEYPRTFTLLEDYYKKVSTINKVFEKIKNSKVMLIGLGAVGTWVSQNLIMSGVKNLIIVDGDEVEISNLHRQIGFSYDDIHKTKVDAFENNLLEIDNNLNITKIKDYLDSDFFDRYKFENIDLIINCADYPSVDETSRLIGEYCMKNRIAHIIGGGYNLHLSLIGQLVIPYETACVNCFKMSLEDLNQIDTKNIRKLDNKNRKIGSFTPLTSLSASITSNEAFKYLAGIKVSVMQNKRTEFLVDDMNFKNIVINRREDCDWCGK